MRGSFGRLLWSFVLVGGLVAIQPARGVAQHNSGELRVLTPVVHSDKIANGDHAEILRLFRINAISDSAVDRSQIPSTASHWLSRVAEKITIFPVLNVEFKNEDTCRNFKMEHTTILTRIDRFADLFIGDPQAFNAIRTHPDIVWTELAGRAFAPPPQIGRELATRANADLIVRNGIGPKLTGKGVIIAILDTGIDFRNPDFITFDNTGQPTSRLLYFWDTLQDSNGEATINSPVQYPNQAPIGRLYSRTELTAELRSHRPKLQVWDTNGHGTACAGIAAGNGQNGKDNNAGVAPEADIIAVRIGEGPSLANAYLIGSICEWLDKEAGKRPLVVSCSFSGQYGGHDGFRIAERQINARFPADKPGRAICIAAGNDAQLPIHATIDIGQSKQTAEIHWKSTESGQLSVYFDTNVVADLKFQVSGPAGKLSAFVHPLSNQLTCEVPIGPGDGRLLVTYSGQSSVRAEAYLTSLNGNAQFDATSVAADHLIGSPGSAESAITVGSYDFNELFDTFGRKLALGDMSRPGLPLTIGAISTYSSPGPLRGDKLVKPDFVAPGQFFTASAPMNAKVLLRDSSGRYQLFNGTSAATPYVAGIVVLMMQSKPTLTTQEIKSALKNNAKSNGDPFVGNVPNPLWGYGKLDVEAVIAAIKSLK